MMYPTFEGLKAGCPKAFAEIHVTYNRRIFWIGKQFIADTFVVDTLVQDTFLKLWIHRDRIETPGHIFYFLRLVMKRACISHYTKPRNRFFRKVNSLESYTNFQDYLAGYDPIVDIDHLTAQQTTQAQVERINSTLPLLHAEKQQLIQLCLKHGFKYKAISKLMGMNTTQTANTVKLAIQDLKSIIRPESVPDTKQDADIGIGIPDSMTQRQAAILELRSEKKYSFAQIAEALDLTLKEVHRDFMVAYKLEQAKSVPSL